MQAFQTQLDKVNQQIAAIAATRNAQGEPRTPPHLLRALEDKSATVRRQTQRISALAVVANISPTDDWANGGALEADTALNELKRDHELALKAVEKECIKRLFEMDKLGFAGTAYRFRKEIMNATRTRSKSLEELIRQCNLAAKAAGRRVTLGWNDVTDTSMPVSLLTILRSMDPDELLRQPWTHKVTREAVRFKMPIERAAEELELLDVEWRRLRIWVVDREEALMSIIAREIARPIAETESLAEQSSIVSALQQRLYASQRAHRRILWSLEKCKGQLISSGALQIGMVIPERSQSLQHLPEMNTYNNTAWMRDLKAGGRFPTVYLPTIPAFQHGVHRRKDLVVESYTHRTDRSGRGARIGRGG